VVPAAYGSELRCQGEVAALRDSNGTQVGASAIPLRLARSFSCKLIYVI